MKTVSQLSRMTTREIALDAKSILATNDYYTAKKLLQDHMRIANEKMERVAERVNKEFGSRRVPPKIKVISDFNRFR